MWKKNKGIFCVASTDRGRDIKSGLRIKKGKNQPWNNGLVQNWERSMSRFYIFTCLFNIYEEDIMWNAQLDEAQAGIKIAGRSINNLKYADDATLIAESEEDLKSLLMKNQRGVKKLA